MTQELTIYYSLNLWRDYLEAKEAWEHAHAEYADAPSGQKDRSYASLMETRSKMDSLLRELRDTPEHLNAFGW